MNAAFISDRAAASSLNLSTSLDDDAHHPVRPAVTGCSADS